MNVVDALSPAIYAQLLDRGYVVGDPSAERPGARKEIYRIRRFFFPKQRNQPVEIVEALIRDAYVLENQRSKTYPYYDMGLHWRKDERSSAWMDETGRWHDGSSSPSIMRLAPRGGYPYPVAGKRVEGHYVATIPCNSRCVNATKNVCECSCGGKNHGAGVSLRWVDNIPSDVRRYLWRIHEIQTQS